MIKTPGTPPTARPTYPPDPNLWTPVADLGETRIWHAAALLPDGRVLVTGGATYVPLDEFEIDGVTLDTVEIFDPATGSWTAGPPMRDAREDHRSITLADGRVMVVGGFSSAAGTNVGQAVTSAEIYDPAANAWTRVRDVPDREGWVSTTLLADGRVFLIGWTTRAYPREQKAVMFDPDTGAWSPVAETELVRDGHRAVALRDGTVLVAGGLDPRGHEAQPLDGAAVYDPSTDTWTDVGPMLVSEFNMPMALLPDGRVLAVSGINQLYDPASTSWAPAGGPGPSQAAAAVVLPDGRVLVFPNAGGPNAVELQVYDPRTTSWASSGRFIQITGMTLTRLWDGRVLSAGGYLGCYHDNPCATGDIASAWLFDPAGTP